MGLTMRDPGTRESIRDVMNALDYLKGKPNLTREQARIMEEQVARLRRIHGRLSLHMADFSNK